MYACVFLCTRQRPTSIPNKLKQIYITQNKFDGNDEKTEKKFLNQAQNIESQKVALNVWLNQYWQWHHQWISVAQRKRWKREEIKVSTISNDDNEAEEMWNQWMDGKNTNTIQEKPFTILSFCQSDDWKMRTNGRAHFEMWHFCDPILPFAIKDGLCGACVCVYVHDKPKSKSFSSLYFFPFLLFGSFISLLLRVFRFSFLSFAQNQNVELSVEMKWKWQKLKQWTIYWNRK